MAESVRGSLDGCTALVTGATGFIGGRVVERLVLEHGADVRALVRHYGNAARLARFDVAMPSGTIEDGEAIDRAIAGADVVFNLAYVTDNSIDANVAAIDHVIDACLRHGVRRLVQISSFMVNTPFTDGEIDSEMPVDPYDDVYGQAKVAVEQRVLRAVQEHQLPAVVLRPSIVYGPYGGYWTDRPARELLAGQVVLPDDGGGICNAVYVDDVVDAMFLAATQPEAIGKSFLISGPDPVTWKTFYAGIEQGLGIDALQYRVSDHEADSGPMATVKQGLADPRRLAERVLTPRVLATVRGALGEPIKRPIRRLYRRYRKYVPQPISDDFNYAATARCRLDRERELLGYEPRFDIEAGMALTQEYLRWAYPRDRDQLEEPGFRRRPTLPPWPSRRP